MAQIMKGHMAFHGIKQAQMAEAVGISQSQLSKILRADRPIDLETFEAFCAYLGEDASALVSEGQKLAESRSAQEQMEEDDGVPADFDSWDKDAQARWIAAHPNRFDLAAKHGDTEAEQEAYEAMP